jgi:hypothetical protein
MFVYNKHHKNTRDNGFMTEHGYPYFFQNTNASVATRASAEYHDATLAVLDRQMCIYMIKTHVHIQ